MNDGLKALNTKYNGYNFRSRTEARWAVFMDSIRVKYEYEIEAYDLGGIYYLPDFWIPVLDYFIEIKPFAATEDEEWKASALATQSGKNVYIFSGQPEAPNFDEGYTESSQVFMPGGGGDFPHWWCQCRKCGRYGIHYLGRAERINCKCPTPEGEARYYNFDSSSLLLAYHKARAFRFDKGGTQ